MADPPAPRDVPLPALTDRDRDILAQITILDEVKDLGIASFSGFSYPGLVVVDQPDLVCSIISTCAQVKLDHAVVQDDKRAIVICLRQAAKRGAQVSIQLGRLTLDADKQQRLRNFRQDVSVENDPIAAAIGQARLLLEEVANGLVSNNCLSLFISGPSIQNLSVICFPSPKRGSHRDVTIDDIESLPASLKTCIKNEVNVLLVASSANTDHRTRDFVKELTVVVTIHHLTISRGP